MKAGLCSISISSNPPPSSHRPLPTSNHVSCPHCEFTHAYLTATVALPARCTSVIPHGASVSRAEPSSRPVSRLNRFSLYCLLSAPEATTVPSPRTAIRHSYSCENPVSMVWHPVTNTNRRNIRQWKFHQVALLPGNARSFLNNKSPHHL